MTALTVCTRESGTARLRCSFAPQRRRQFSRLRCRMPWQQPAVVALAAAIAFCVLPSQAAEQHHTVVPAEDLTWVDGPPTLPSGAQLAVLFGNPAEEGPFAFRLKFPAGYEVPAHWHTKDELVTVIAGKFNVGAGDKLDRNTSQALAPGSFVHLPAGMRHFAWTAEETVVQINGTGPFDVTYVDPDDDPRTH